MLIVLNALNGQKDMIKIQDFEVFKFGENIYTEFQNNGKTYLLNRHPYLDVVLTDYCNANCSFCIADLIHKKLKGDLEIMKEKIKFAVTQMRVREVLVLGGEPTMSPILLPMISFLKTLDLDKIIMTTNGIRLATEPTFREAVLSSGLTHVNLSFMSTNSDNQSRITTTDRPKMLTLDGVADIYETAQKHGVKVRINNNIFKTNNDTLGRIVSFYNAVKPYCDSVKFSPLFPVDTFSVLDVKTQWVKDNILENDYVENLFSVVEDYFSTMNNDIQVIVNDLQFGFVKNTLIPLKIPIIMNWNFGKYTGMMKKVVEEHKINNLKLLPNNELSLSWNRELKEYFIKTT